MGDMILAADRSIPSDADSSATARLERRRLNIRGLVQGLGFRPYVWRLAQSHGLSGSVCNSPAGVMIEIEGPPQQIESFISRLPPEAPPLAQILCLEQEHLPACGEQGFRIVNSQAQGEASALVLPDLATCSACRQEIFDPSNRRWRYPFTNCTDCGPRYSIIAGLPYDRPLTAMAAFRMCPACQAEYADPGDRRFHAQPNACPDCGPKLSYADPTGRILAESDHALTQAATLLRSGGILALKGIGGYQLLADARSPDALARLRTRKQRPSKPLAVMFPDLDAVCRHCRVSAEEARQLSSVQAPIVLLDRHSCEDGLASGINPVAPLRLGAFLPYSPLHHLLLQDLGFAVVATSGNLSDDPLEIDNARALTHLNAIADGFLMHDRPILHRVDDSLLHCVAGEPMLLRRARGYAPLPLPGAQNRILAVGGQLKNTFALSRPGQIFLSPHLGDLDTLSAREAWQETRAHFCQLLASEAEVLACDLHPDYASGALARSLHRPGQRLQPVQHHLAHVLAVIAEHGLDPAAGPILGVAWDGAGFGSDGTIWGGEFITVSPSGWQRAGSLRPFAFAGGEAAFRKPAWLALALLEAIGRDADGLPPAKVLPPADRALLLQRLRQGKGLLCSSAGRLFDGLASLLDLRQFCDFEAEAAMALEALAQGADSAQHYDLPLLEAERLILDWSVLIEALLRDLPSVPRPRIAAGIHQALAEGILTMARAIGCSRVVLGGGCFQNRLLLEWTLMRLQQAGFKVYWPQAVPANDGGLALGQLWAVETGIEQEPGPDRVQRRTADVSGNPG
ncbi:MAG: carbamoyltransferase HypF [Candidatus Sericytochromatia bacterium]